MTMEVYEDDIMMKYYYAVVATVGPLTRTEFRHPVAEMGCDGFVLK